MSAPSGNKPTLGRVVIYRELVGPGHGDVTDLRNTLQEFAAIVTGLCEDRGPGFVHLTVFRPRQGPTTREWVPMCAHPAPYTGPDSGSWSWPVLLP